MAIVINKAQFPILIKETGAILPFDGVRRTIPDNLVPKYRSLLYIVSMEAAPPSDTQKAPETPHPIAVGPSVSAIPPQPVITPPPEKVVVPQQAALTNDQPIQNAEPISPPLKGVRILARKSERKLKHQQKARQIHMRYAITKTKRKAQQDLAVQTKNEAVVDS